MKYKIADNAGFCFGVKRAMNKSWDVITENEGKRVFSLGPLIHNKQAVSKYEEKGLVVKDDIEEIDDKSTMIIRSHGVAKSVYDDAEAKDIKVIDATCPFVLKIHSLANESYKDGYKIIVIGDKKHPEVIGINGWCDDTAIIIKTPEDIDSYEFDKDAEYAVVAQTTMNERVYEEIIDRLNEMGLNMKINNTICSATRVRQQSARSLAQEVDAMIVVGGKHSSNTQKLVSICEQYVPTFAIETRDELDESELMGFETVGLTAGASTPDWIIQEVIDFIESL